MTMQLSPSLGVVRVIVAVCLTGFVWTALYFFWKRRDKPGVREASVPLVIISQTWAGFSLLGWSFDDIGVLSCQAGRFLTLMMYAVYLWPVVLSAWLVLYKLRLGAALGSRNPGDVIWLARYRRFTTKKSFFCIIAAVSTYYLALYSLLFLALPCPNSYYTPVSSLHIIISVALVGRLCWALRKHADAFDLVSDLGRCTRVWGILMSLWLVYKTLPFFRVARTFYLSPSSFGSCAIAYSAFVMMVQPVRRSYALERKAAAANTDTAFRASARPTRGARSSIVKPAATTVVSGRYAAGATEGPDLEAGSPTALPDADADAIVTVTIREVLANNAMRHHFRAFCVRALCAENLGFCEAFDALQRLEGHPPAATTAAATTATQQGSKDSKGSKGSKGSAGPSDDDEDAVTPIPPDTPLSAPVGFSGETTPDFSSPRQFRRAWDRQLAPLEPIPFRSNTDEDAPDSPKQFCNSARERRLKPLEPLLLQDSGGAAGAAAAAEALYSEYINPVSVFAINLPHRTRARLEKDFAEGLRSARIFRAARDDVFRILAGDVFTRFQCSPEHAQMMAAARSASHAALSPRGTPRIQAWPLSSSPAPLNDTPRVPGVGVSSPICQQDT